MPYVNVRITREGATPAQKAAIIKGVTDLLVEVLDKDPATTFVVKDPATTFVVIDEVEPVNWGVGGLPVPEYRNRPR